MVNAYLSEVGRVAQRFGKRAVGILELRGEVDLAHDALAIPGPSAWPAAAACR